VQIEYDVVHFRTFLVQLFALLQLNFEEVVQINEVRRFGGAPNGYPFAASMHSIGYKMHLAEHAASIVHTSLSMEEPDQATTRRTWLLDRRGRRPE
jgi:hypothetical protein